MIVQVVVGPAVCFSFGYLRYIFRERQYQPAVSELSVYKDSRVIQNSITVRALNFHYRGCGKNEQDMKHRSQYITAQQSSDFEQIFIYIGVLVCAPVCLHTTRLREPSSVDFIFHYIGPVKETVVKVEV